MSQVTVAVLNTSKEITTMLREILEGEGYNTCELFTYEIREDGKRFKELLDKHHPNAIIYDIAIPYKENYDLFKKISALDETKHIPIVLTTTNRTALESIVGKTPAHELIGKPYDIQDILSAVKKALR